MVETASLEPNQRLASRSGRGPWARWLSLLGHRETGESLALFRMACGLVILSWIGGAAWHGVVGDLWLDSSYGGYREPPSNVPWLFDLLGGATPVAVWSVIGVLLAGGAALVAGLGGRITALLVLQAHLAIDGLNENTAGGDTQLIANCLWLLVLAPATATWSADCRLRTGRWRSDRLVPAWPRYLVVYQLVLVYFFTGLQKVSIYWSYAGDYAALYYIVQEPTWQQFDMAWLAPYFPLTQIMTAAVWYWEVAAPLLLLATWYRLTPDRKGWLRRLFNRLRFRRWYVAFGVAMHLGIFVMLGLGPFTWITLSMYICLFSSAEWRAFFARLRRADSVAAGETRPTVGAGAEMTIAGRPRPWLGYAVVALVTFHVAAVTLMALPAPSRVTAADLETPLFRDEVSRYAAALRGWGFDVTDRELADWMLRTTASVHRVRSTVLAPFQPYYTYCGTRQGWRMFVGPNMYPTRLYLEIQQADGRWRPVYIERHAEHDWLSQRIDREAWRTVIYTVVYQGDWEEYRRVVAWLARRAAADFPQARRFRARLYRFKTPTPAEVLAGAAEEGEFDWEYVVEFKRLQE